jgi:hypothetical protein
LIRLEAYQSLSPPRGAINEWCENQTPKKSS